MKPYSAKWRNVQRRFYRRYRKKLKQIPFLEICQMQDSRRRALLMEILLLKFFLAGVLWLKENPMLLTEVQDMSLPNYPHFHAQDVPIFLDPGIMELFQQTSNDKEILENGRYEHVRI